jgi:hypothetical protein
MSAGRMWAAQVVAVIFAGVSVVGAATVDAAGQEWSGRYTVVSYAAAKTGTSVAARQPEPDFSAEYVFVTECSSGKCVATVVDGPVPRNSTLPQPQRYTWDGTQWEYVYDWQWECFRGDGVPRVFSAARSWMFYVPQSDGSLQGAWHTDIFSGDCRGNVIMPVAAYPVGPR